MRRIEPTIASGHAANEPFGLANMRHGQPHRSPATTLATFGALLDFGQIQPVRGGALLQLSASQIARLLADATGKLDPVLGVKITDLDIVLPTHQKSSALGIRV